MPYSQTREFRFSAPWIAISCLLVGSILNWASHYIASRLGEVDLMPTVAAQSVYSVMFITFLLVIPFVSHGVEKVGQIHISSGFVTTAFSVSVALGIAATNIRLQDNETRFLVSFEVFIFALCAVLTMLRVFLLVTEDRNWTASVLLLGPTIGHLLCTALFIQKLQSYMFVLLALQMALLLLVTIPVKTHIENYSLQRARRFGHHLSEINIVFYFLLLAGTVIPIGLAKVEQDLLVEALNRARLPLYGSMLFSILMLPHLLAEGSNELHKLAQRRKFVFVSNSISLTAGLVVLISYVVASGSPGESRTLDLLAMMTSLSLALLMPWLVFRILDKELDIPAAIASSVVLIAYLFGWLNSAIRWPLVGSIAFVILVSMAIARHILESQRLMGQKQRPLFAETKKSRDSMISVVVPSYNPGLSIVTTLNNLRSTLSNNFERFEIIVVTDGSTDESPELIEALTPQITHVWMNANRGKGSALREGFSRTRGEVVAFIDADGDLDVESLPQMIKVLIDNNLDIVYGSKLHPDSIIEMSPLRKVVSFCFRLLVRVLFQIDIADTQTGIKVFDGSLIRTISPYCRESGFNLDLELFVLANEFGCSNYKSHPIKLRRTGGTTVGISTLLNMFASILKLFIRVNLSLDYTTDRAQLEGTK
jgi:dolichol-phosphate mannosyltransferase